MRLFGDYSRYELVGGRSELPGGENIVPPGEIERKGIMVGITSYGAYIPLLRISRKTISAATGWLGSGPGLPGEKVLGRHLHSLPPPGLLPGGHRAGAAVQDDGVGNQVHFRPRGSAAQEDGELAAED